MENVSTTNETIESRTTFDQMSSTQFMTPRSDSFVLIWSPNLLPFIVIKIDIYMFHFNVCLSIVVFNVTFQRLLLCIESYALLISLKARYVILFLLNYFP